MIIRRVFRCCWLTLLAPALVQASGLPKSFTLGQYVPEDFWMYVHGVSHPESEWIEARYLEVFKELKNTGIDKDIKGLILSLLDDEQKAQFEAVLTKIINLVGGVRWGELVAKEMVIAERLYPGLPGYEYVFLARGEEASVEANLAGLTAILKEIATHFPSTKIEQTTRDGVEQWIMHAGEKEKGLEFDIALIRRGDVIGLVLGQPSVPLVVSLLAGKSEAKSILANEKFKEALGNVPAPENTIAYFDLKSFMKGLGGLIKMATDASSDADAKQAQAGIRKLLEMVDFIDYVVTTEETEGHRKRSHSYTKLQALEKPSVLGKAVFDRKPFEKFDQYIPADAVSFSVDTFLDLEYLYKAVIEFIETSGADGKAGVQQWNATLSAFGFDPQRDLFSWWSGEMISFNMPAAIVTPMSPTDSVLMIRVKDGKLASEKVAAFLQKVSGVLQQQGQGLSIKSVDVGAEGFNEVVYAPIAMFARPVVGVTGEWLVLASSAGAVKKSLAVAAGNAPSIVKNERYMKEGIIPKGPVLSASFSDTSNLGQEIAAVLGSIGFAGAMASAMIPPDNPQAKKLKDFVGKSTSILTKLAPVAAKLDFYSSESMVMTRDGLVIRTEEVTTYKVEAMNRSRTAKADSPGD